MWNVDLFLCCWSRWQWHLNFIGVDLKCRWWKKQRWWRFPSNDWWLFDTDKWWMYWMIYCWGCWWWRSGRHSNVCPRYLRWSKEMKTVRKAVYWCKRTYVWLIAVAENDSDRNAGFRGRGRLVILILRRKKRWIFRCWWSVWSILVKLLWWTTVELDQIQWVVVNGRNIDVSRCQSLNMLFTCTRFLYECSPFSYIFRC